MPDNIIPLFPEEEQGSFFPALLSVIAVMAAVALLVAAMYPWGSA